MADPKIQTNNRPRDTLTWLDLTPAEQGEFEYLNTDERQSDATFARYRGIVYDLGEFMRTPKGAGMDAWVGYHGDSYFSGILVRDVDDGERVVMATYYS